MSYKSGHIYLVDKEPTNEELANFSKPVQFDICKDGLFYSILYDKNGNRYVEDRSKITTGFIKLGTIVRVGNVINIGVHPSGFNHWRINGVDVTSSNPVVLELEPETVLYRIDSIVGNSAGGIFIFQGDANKNPLPTNSLNYPNYAFFLDVLITPNSGGSIDPEILNNYVAKEEENWKEITLGISSDFVIDYSDERTRFKISSLGETARTLTGIVFSDETERAVEFWVYNNTGGDININNVSTSGLRKGFRIYGESFKIIAYGKALLKYNPATDIIECWKDNSTADNSGGISSVTTDSTLQGDGSEADPLGLSEDIKDEIEGIQTSVNNIQVGARNLILNSKINATVNNSESKFIFWSELSENLEIGSTYIFRGFNKNKAFPELILSDAVENYNNVQIILEGVPFVAQFASKSIRTYHSAGDGGFSVKAIKLEKGNKATDWTPAPEDVDAQVATKQDKSMFSALVDKMIHFYDSATQKMLSTGVEFISAGILKLKSVILTTNSGTALPNELGFDGTNVVFGASKKKLAFKDEIFEHNVRGKRVELSGVGGTNLNIDLSTGNLFAITNTGTGNVPITLINMIGTDETIVFNMIVTGNLLTIPTGWIPDAYNDVPDVNKKRKYIVTIEKGGASPIISYNLINI